ncbi:arylsulfatase A-like [Lytechinus pictus]|uniref:arylsulfatase A-like n=1 Tax=Lytechinus pictus TaxID=7653 RepID=UPI0030B9B0C1
MPDINAIKKNNILNKLTTMNLQDISLNCCRIVAVLFIWISNSYAAQSKPNIVLLYTDDLGFGDLQAYGHPTSSTPNLNRLAAEGLRFTQFYSSAPVCSPSRAAILTGRYHVRTGVYPGVFDPASSGGLPHNETTLAEILRPLGYRTSIIGKWHLGVGKDGEYLPTSQGFDHYYGIPYSQDFCPCLVCFYPKDPCFDDCRTNESPCPIFNDTVIVEQPANLTTIEARYTNLAKKYISDNAAADQPFFLYYAYHHTHHPQFAGEQFRNTTIRGTFGDSLAELDWSVGEVLNQLDSSGIADNTFIFFTSDNGPSLTREVRGGNAGLLKCGKGTTYEGGVRVPGIARWPGRINPGRTIELASQIDLLPTIANITGATLPEVLLDGVDMSPILFEGKKSLREDYIYYPVNANPKIGIYAVRWHQYKAHYYTQGAGTSGSFNHDKDCRPTANRTSHNPPLLYDLHQDASELYDLRNSTNYPEVIAEIEQVKAKFEATMFWPKSEVRKPDNKNLEPCCDLGCTPFPECCQCHSDSDRAASDHDGHLHWTKEMLDESWRSRPIVQVQEQEHLNGHR